MLRSRYMRLVKLIVIVISVSIFMTYMIKRRWRSLGHSEVQEQSRQGELTKDLYSVNNFINISWQFSGEAVKAEVMSDLVWLKTETIDEAGPPSRKFKRRLQSMRRAKKSSYLVVEYTTVFFKPKFCNKPSEQIFNSEIERCPYQNCEYSCVKSDEKVRSADALLFHQRDLESEFSTRYQSNLDKWLELTTQLPFKTTKAKLANNPSQIWILWNDEATHVDTSLNKISQLFNWTLSYRTTSEVYKGSYGFLKPNGVERVSDYVILKRQVFEKEYLSRKNAILWFVSNCKSKERMRVALEISRHYPVYIYGKCDFSIVSSNSNDHLSEFKYLHTVNSTCAPESSCESEQLAGFKYYLAFENTNCSDYVTEKVWRSLNKHIIPIVLQPARESYTRYRIPSKAIIHLEDFEYNEKHLADYLKRIDSSFSLYYEHVKWTSVYMNAHFVNNVVEPHRMCELCRMLNTYDSFVYYERIASFFNYQCINL